MEKRLSGEEVEDLVQTCKLLVDEAILWEASLYGEVYPSVTVYLEEESGTVLHVAPAADNVAFLLERIKLILEGATSARHNN